MMSSDRDQRVEAALPRLDDRARERAAEHEWALSLLNAEDPDERAILIRLAHPDLDEAIESGADEVVVGGEPMNPRIHLAIHEIVATQVIDDDPPEAFATLQRLRTLGRDPHDALHMLGSAVAAQLWAAPHERRAYDREEHVRALAALPGSWDRQLAGVAGTRRPGESRRARRRR